jgi:uncharacterized protein YcfJ
MDTIDAKKIGVLQTGHLNETLGHIVPPPAPIICSIGLDSFAITNTRSRHEDTDFVTVSLAIANRPTLSQTRALGNLNNGNFPLDMIFSNVSITPGEIAVLTYGMVNSGHQSPGEVATALETAFKTLATKGAQIAATAIGGAIGGELGASIGTAAVPIIGTALGALAGFLVGGAFGLLFADCDGPVAAAVHTLTYDQIKAALAGGNGLVHTDDQPGINSADGCGSNSHYTVTWSAR